MTIVNVDKNEDEVIPHRVDKQPKVVESITDDKLHIVDELPLKSYRAQVMQQQQCTLPVLLNATSTVNADGSDAGDHSSSRLIIGVNQSREICAYIGQKEKDWTSSILYTTSNLIGFDSMIGETQNQKYRKPIIFPVNETTTKMDMSSSPLQL
ncbi:hypothetical protein RND71_028585 [Anisodus tanguticus]|uniref:Uncharacterized protein n=1 Tax=Anisodus tanguticus TaxID=243964 RepID=A0AAE1RLB6_9SOLA|nr:hypothetical protein RND71_028585 [Anisodus tanguticus]